ncbi:MAG: AMP-binding protein [Candidatus Lokiarchaeota archaeon]
MKSGKGRITKRTSGNRGYKSTWLYIPSKISKDESFPFKNQEKVIVELEGNQLIVKKSYSLSDLTSKYGVPDATLPDLIQSKADSNKSKPFLIFQNQKFSYSKTNQISNQIANGLLKLIENLDLNNPNIAILFPNYPDAIFCWFGIAKTGNLCVPIGNNLNEDYWEYILRNSNSKILFIDYNYYLNLKKILSDLPELKKIILRNAPKGFQFNKKLMSYQEILSDNLKNPNLDISPSQPLEIIYTAGTTGNPKGVIYRNHHTLSGISVGRKLEGIGFNDSEHKIYCPLPLFQSTARYLVIIPVMYYNNIVIISNKFDVSTFWNDINHHKPDGFCYYGAYLSELMNQEPKITDRKHSLKYAFGFGAFRKKWDSFERRFGIEIIEGWGIAESVGLTINNIGSKGGKVGSVGIPVRGYELKIVDPNGNELPPGRNNIGEMIARTKLSIRLEYYNLKNGTNSALEKKGWTHTGDFGYRDKDNFIYFLGRKDDIIHRENETFFALDIERVANGHPLVINSAAFEVDLDSSQNKALKICVEIKKGVALSYQELHSYLKENLAYFMVPIELLIR